MKCYKGKNKIIHPISKIGEKLNDRFNKYIKQTDKMLTSFYDKNSWQTRHRWTLLNISMEKQKQ